jgi:hypothetical protein
MRPVTPTKKKGMFEITFNVLGMPARSKGLVVTNMISGSAKKKGSVTKITNNTGIAIVHIVV